MLPFFGTAAVAYLPSNGRIVGLSKLARTVKYCAAGLMTQERLASDITNVLSKNLETENVAVILRARHLCMEFRGVKVPGAETTTSKMLGAFREDGRVRDEFLRLSGMQ